MRIVTQPEWAEPLYRPCRRKVLYGGRGSGKSWAFAMAAVVHCATRPTEMVCLREYYASIKDSTLPNLILQANRLGLDGFTWKRDEATHRNGSRIVFHGFNTVSEESMRGWENKDLVWVDEAHVMRDSAWEILRNTVRKKGSEIWFSLNPKYRSDPVYRDFVASNETGAWVKKVNYYDNPWFPEELEIERRAALNNPRYAHIWEGEPDDEGEERLLLPYSLLQLCVDNYRPVSANRNTCHSGFDVADTGADSSAYAFRKGPCLENVHIWRAKKIGDSVNRVHEYAVRDRSGYLYYDASGIGNDLRNYFEDKLRPYINKYGKGAPYAVKPLHAGGQVGGPTRPVRTKAVFGSPRVTNKEYFFNRASQLGWVLRLRAERTVRLLDGENINPSYCLFINPEIRDLQLILSELNRPQWDDEQKLRIRKKGSTGKSPDAYDAVALAFAYDSAQGLYLN